jgi:hypothetical protein
VYRRISTVPVDVVDKNKWAKIRAEKVKRYTIFVRHNPDIGGLKDLWNIFKMRHSNWRGYIFFRYMACMYRKYLDRDLVKAIRIKFNTIPGMVENPNPGVFKSAYEEFADNRYYVFSLRRLWSWVPDSHLLASKAKVQRRLQLLDDIRQLPVQRFRRKLLYLAVVLGCDTPIVEAIDYHTISSILPDKN